MGVSIDIHSYDYAALCTQISDIADMANTEGRSAQEFIDVVLPNFGVIAGDRFVVLWNEYYDDYNSGSELMKAVDLYFGIEDTFLGNYGYVPHANAYEVLEELGIEPIKVDEDEDD